jgi:GMP synthase-like glutamine amidotransferase
MQVAILEAGQPPADLVPRFGDYPAMFADLLGGEVETVAYDATSGQLPEREDAHPAYLVTGSPAGAYDDHVWIAPLRNFLQAAKGRAKLVGICFGHQLMAEAFGGRVERSERGWGAGLQRYEVVEQAPWMDAVEGFAVPVSHQDQIVALPSRARVLAANTFSPFGLIAYEDQPAISFQGHPEFRPDYAAALYEVRRARLPDADAAIASLDAPDDRARVGEWIRRFLAA